MSPSVAGLLDRMNDFFIWSSEPNQANGDPLSCVARNWQFWDGSAEFETAAEAIISEDQQAEFVAEFRNWAQKRYGDSAFGDLLLCQLVGFAPFNNWEPLVDHVDGAVAAGPHIIYLGKYDEADDSVQRLRVVAAPDNGERRFRQASFEIEGEGNTGLDHVSPVLGSILGGWIFRFLFVYWYVCVRQERALWARLAAWIPVVTGAIATFALLAAALTSEQVTFWMGVLGVSGLVLVLHALCSFFLACRSARREAVAAKDRFNSSVLYLVLPDAPRGITPRIDGASASLSFCLGSLCAVLPEKELSGYWRDLITAVRRLRDCATTGKLADGGSINRVEGIERKIAACLRAKTGAILLPNQKVPPASVDLAGKASLKVRKNGHIIQLGISLLGSSLRVWGRNLAACAVILLVILARGDISVSLWPPPLPQITTATKSNGPGGEAWQLHARPVDYKDRLLVRLLSEHYGNHTARLYAHEESQNPEWTFVFFVTPTDKSNEEDDSVEFVCRRWFLSSRELPGIVLQRGSPSAFWSY